MVQPLRLFQFKALPSGPEPDMAFVPVGALTPFPGHTVFKTVRFPDATTPVLLLPASRYPQDILFAVAGTSGTFDLTFASSRGNAAQRTADSFQTTLTGLAAPVTLRWPANMELWGLATNIGATPTITIAAAEVPEGA